ncbi:MAG: DinB family protein [Anaerolineaceae bacterium]|nr:DinB family protein [Anaerolineaceae bacterium]
MTKKLWVESTHRQLRASIAMLEAAVRSCPPALWQTPMWQDAQMSADFSRFWYIAYHCLFFADLYLSGSLEGFAPPPPFTLDELNPHGKLPPRVFTQAELLDYADFCRNKCDGVFARLDEAQLHQSCSFPWMEMSYAELLLDNMRHIQEHGAQLNMFLGQQAGVHSSWE